MNLDGLFSNNTKLLKSSKLIFESDYFDIENIENELIKIDEIIVNSYDSNDEDIEDLYDIVRLINMSLEQIIPNEKYSNEILKKIMNLRRNATKRCNKKYRDALNDNRKFWNFEEFQLQHHSGITYVWMPSVKTITDLINNHRHDFVLKKE
jgi:hypothetical protein